MSGCGHGTFTLDAGALHQAEWIRLEPVQVDASIPPPDGMELKDVACAVKAAHALTFDAPASFGSTGAVRRDHGIFVLDQNSGGWELLPEVSSSPMKARTMTIGTFAVFDAPDDLVTPRGASFDSGCPGIRIVIPPGAVAGHRTVKLTSKSLPATAPPPQGLQDPGNICVFETDPVARFAASARIDWIVDTPTYPGKYLRLNASGDGWEELSTHAISDGVYKVEATVQEPGTIGFFREN